MPPLLLVSLTRCHSNKRGYFSDEQFAKARELTDKLANAQGTLVALEQRQQKLVEQFAKAETVLKAHDLTPDSISPS